MRRLMIVTGVAVVVVAVLAVGALAMAGVANAQEGTPPTATPAAPGWGPGRGMMGGYGGGMMGGYGGSTRGPAGAVAGPVHDAMRAAMADALGLTVAELDERQAAGETMWQIAQDQGFTLEEWRAAMLAARAEAIEQLVADGVLTQAQADAMLAHMAQRGPGYGPGAGTGACPMHPEGVPGQTRTRGPQG